MNRMLLHARLFLLALVFAIPAEVALGDVPEVLQQRQQQLFNSLHQVRGAVVGVAAGMGVGSGVVVSRDGIVLTASHVVSTKAFPSLSSDPNAVVDVEDVTITFPDGMTRKARLLGKNGDADAAILKIRGPAPGPNGYPFAEMAQASETKVGEWCFALGHPGGYRADRAAPVRVGRVLSVGSRTVVSDCAILLGDSGGPLFNMQGRVIGIHSMITSLIIENRHASIDVFQTDWDRLLAGERWGTLRASDNDLVESGFFGVVLKWTDFIPEILRVLPRSPAEKAGLKKGDVLVSIDGRPIADRLDLGTTLDVLSEEQSVQVGIRRNGNAEIVSLVTGDDADPDVEDLSDPGENAAVRLSEEDRDNEIIEQLSETRRIGKFEKRTPEQLEPYASVATPNSQSVVAVRDSGILMCLGTIMSSDGYILAKASEVKEAIDPEVIIPGGRRFHAKILGVDYAFDLALLKVDASDLKPVNLRLDTVSFGELALVQDSRGKALIPTVVSVEAHTMPNANKGFMGIQMREVPNGIGISAVIPGGSAYRNGLKEGDIIMTVSGNDVHTTGDLQRQIGSCKPGDKVKIRYMREDKIDEIEIVLTSRFNNDNPLLPLYDPSKSEVVGKFASVYSGGFPRALQIDADVYPTKVGGPLLDLNGRTMGIVIARADRFPTIVIPAESVKAVFEQLKSEAENTQN